MWSFLSNKAKESGKNKELAKNRVNLADNLKRMYKEKLIPLEDYSFFHNLHSFRIDNSDFEAKPMVLLIGQYSTGKTSFIRSAIEQDYPGMRIGPEPTTDTFTIVTDGPSETIVPGNALVSDHSLPFSQLGNFGNAFLNRLNMSMVPCPVLEDIVFIDTPGIAAGVKHHMMHRGYDFTKVIGWFANHADRIILFFDACKLDISDELKRIIEIVRDNDEKLRIVFNKADLLSEQELMRGYGALMWFLGRALPCPEPSRLFVSSFHMGKLRNDDNRHLMELEAQELYEDLQTLPRMAAIKKINDIIKRARQVKVHAFIMGELYNYHQLQLSVVNNKLSSLFYPVRRNRESLLDKLPQVFEKLQRRNDLNFGDFPIIRSLHERLASCDFEKKLRPLKQNLIDEVDKMLNFDAAPLMSIILCGQPIPPYSAKPDDLENNFSRTFQGHSVPPTPQQTLQKTTPSTLQTSASLPNTEVLIIENATTEKTPDSTTLVAENGVVVVEEGTKTVENSSKRAETTKTYKTVENDENTNPDQSMDGTIKGSEKRKYEESSLGQYSRPYSKPSKSPLVGGVNLASLNLLKDTPFALGRYTGLDAGSECFIGGGRSGNSLQSIRSLGYKCKGLGATCFDDVWGIEESKRSQYRKAFVRVAGEDGKASGPSVREELIKSKLPNAVLAKIWRLSDMDRDNCLDEDEFIVAMYLIETKLKGYELPQVAIVGGGVVGGRCATIPRGEESTPSWQQRQTLPFHLVPPSKRHFFEA